MSKSAQLTNNQSQEEAIPHNKDSQNNVKTQIIHHQLLRFNYLKATIATIIMTTSVIGLLFLKYFVSLRIKLFYDLLSDSQINRATHIYIVCSEKSKAICKISMKTMKQKTKVFEFKHLQYKITEKEIKQLVWNFQESINNLLKSEHDLQGLTQEQARSRCLFYGKNEHKVQVPQYSSYLFDVMTNPFFLFQYLISVALILEKYQSEGILMLVNGWLTTSINYLLLRHSYRKIKQSAERQYLVTVIRNKEILQMKNTDLVPGDIYQPKDQIPCDSVIIRGDLFVNQALFTGEDIPIPKFMLTQPSDSHLSHHWVYQGSKIESIREASKVLAVAINVGYTSRKGKIIRKIQTKSTKQPQFFTKLLYFLLELTLATIIVYIATLNYVRSFNIDDTMVVFRLLDFISSGIPAVVPIILNLVYTLCLVRLRRKDIVGLQTFKAVQSGRLKTLCFDKTGTLTHNKVQIRNIFHIQNSDRLNQLTQLFHQPIIQAIFACCNSVQIINGTPKGDQIDVQMFIHSNAQIIPNSDPSVLRTIAIRGQNFEILKIFQYESRFQSMSVLVRHTNQNHYYIFTKGSPEMIHFNSLLKYNDFSQLIKDLSFGGFRSIAFAYRQVKENELSTILASDRTQYLQNTTILGVVAFVNSLKPDAKETIGILTENQINTKVITGDNIYLGVRTAIIAGIIQPTATVAVIEGSRYDKNTKSAEIIKLSTSSQGVITQTSEFVRQFAFGQSPKIVYAIDNDFINARKDDFLHHSVKVFARISPENKAVIIKKHKEIYQSQQSKGTLLQKVFGDCTFKVGMVGDGANDLMAIKEADIGIGIAQADAVYSATFAIKNLLQIVQIIKEAKNTQSQIIDLVQFFTVARMTHVSDAMILIQDTTYFTSLQHSYNNLINHALISVLFALSRPAERLRPQLTVTNFMSLQNHLVFWGNTFIITAGLFLNYKYYSNSEDFVPNPKPQITFPQGYYGQTKSSTLIFLAENIMFCVLALLMYKSSGWKKPFYKNPVFTFVVFIELALAILMLLFTEKLKDYGLEPIALNEVKFVGLIILGTLLVMGVYNKLLEGYQKNKKQESCLQQNNQYKRLIEQRQSER